jgi:hypothetical protein
VGGAACRFHNWVEARATDSNIVVFRVEEAGYQTVNTFAGNFGDNDDQNVRNLIAWPAVSKVQGLVAGFSRNRPGSILKVEQSRPLCLANASELGTCGELPIGLPGLHGSLVVRPVDVVFWRIEPMELPLH